jgi:hypothetical protein
VRHLRLPPSNGQQRWRARRLDFFARCRLETESTCGAGEYRAWLNGLKKDDSLPTLDLGTLLLTYYPRIRGGPFVEAGGGFANYSLEKGTGDPIEPVSKTTPSFAEGWGWGYALGVGWSRLSGFTPRVTYAYGEERRLHAAGDGTVATGWKQKVLLVEVGFRTP